MSLQPDNIKNVNYGIKYINILLVIIGYFMFLIEIIIIIDDIKATYWVEIYIQKS
jgi:hypothetical protein